MGQFDVYRFSNGAMLVDLQSDLVDCGTRVMAPLVPDDGRELPFERLEPVVSIAGRRYFVQLSQLAAVMVRRLPTEPDHSLHHDQDRLKDAIDFLIRGF